MEITSKQFTLEEIFRGKWFKVVRRDNSPLFNSLLRAGSAVLNPALDFNSAIKSHLIIRGATYARSDEFERLKKEMEGKMAIDTSFLRHYLTQGEKECRDYLRVMEELSKKYREGSARQTQLEIYRQYCELTLKVLCHLWPPLAVQDRILSELERSLAEYINPKTSWGDFQKALQLLLTDPRPSSVQNREKTVLSLAVRLGDDFRESSGSVEKAYRQYRWVDDHGLQDRGETLEHFIADIKEQAKNGPKAKLAALKKKETQIKQSIVRLARHYKFGSDLKRLSNVAGILPHFRFRRLDVIVQGFYMLKDSLFADIARTINTSKITDLYFWEIDQLLEDKSKVPPKRDSELYGFFLEGSDVMELSDSDMDWLERKFNTSEGDRSEIKGSPACQGRGKGVVKIIFSDKDFSKFQEGDILVTSMTMPYFVPIMKLASAIVTDEGGITCHAAIVSRELNKPCVIGTKIATKVLKDGDIVEVDANTGVIKILKKAV